MIEKEIAEIESDLKILKKQQASKDPHEAIELPDKTWINPWFVLEDQICELECRLLDLKRQQKELQTNSSKCTE